MCKVVGIVQNPWVLLGVTVRRDLNFFISLET
jgi:hypothetical protein